MSSSSSDKGPKISRFDFAGLRDFIKSIPAGESRPLILDNVPLVATTEDTAQTLVDKYKAYKSEKQSS